MARTSSAQGLSNGTPDISHEGAGNCLGGHDRVGHAAMKHYDTRIIAKMTLAKLIDKYTKEIGGIKPFGKNKKAVLAALTIQLGTVLPALMIERLTKFIQDRRKAGASGVTSDIDRA